MAAYTPAAGGARSDVCGRERLKVLVVLQDVARSVDVVGSHPVSVPVGVERKSCSPDNSWSGRVADVKLHGMPSKHPEVIDGPGELMHRNGHYVIIEVSSAVAGGHGKSPAVCQRPACAATHPAYRSQMSEAGLHELFRAKERHWTSWGSDPGRF
jgi:hypothetical protein